MSEVDPAITKQSMVRTWMAGFGAPTKKLSMLWGSEVRALEKLSVQPPKNFKPQRLEVVTHSTTGFAWPNACGATISFVNGWAWGLVWRLQAPMCFRTIVT
eukprot:15464501-Alexandrium_andersonii.AAC.1